MKYFRQQLASLLLMLFVTSCGITKQYSVAEKASVSAENERFALFLTEKEQNTPLQFNGSLVAQTSENEQTPHVNANLFFVPSEGISLSVRPIPFVEAATIYVMPNQIIVFDKINRYFFSTSYSELSKKIGFEVSYSSIESIIFARYLFSKSIGREKWKYENGAFSYYTGVNDGLSVSYIMDKQLAKPYALQIKQKENSLGILQISYNSYQQTQWGLLPQTLSIELIGNKKPITISLNFNSIRHSNQATKHITPPTTSSYTKLTFEQLSKYIHQFTN